MFFISAGVPDTFRQLAGDTEFAEWQDRRLHRYHQGYVTPPSPGHAGFPLCAGGSP